MASLSLSNSHTTFGSRLWVLGFNERRIMEPKLPYELRMKIWNYKDNGYKNKDIVHLVEDGAEP